MSETETLEDRLLCVEISEAAVYISQIVLEVVASIAPFVSFLMLSNRVHEYKAHNIASVYVKRMLADCLPSSFFYGFVTSDLH